MEINFYLVYNKIEGEFSMKKVNIKIFSKIKAALPSKQKRTKSKKEKGSKIKFTMDFKALSQIKIKGGLFRRLMVTFTLLSLLTLSVSALSIYTVTKQKVSADFEKSTTQILNQNMNYVSIIDTSIEELSTQLITNKDFTDSFDVIPDDTYEKYVLAKKLQDKILSLSGGGTSTFVKSIYLLNDDGLSIASDGGDVTSQEKIDAFKKTSDYKNAMDGGGKPVWSAVHENTFSLSHEKILSFMRVIKNPATLKPIGLLMINTDPDLFASSLKNAEIGKSGYMFITDNNGSILAHKDPLLAGKNVDKSLWSKVKDLKQATFTYKDGKSMYGVVNTYGLRNWKMIAVVENSELSSTANSIGLVSIPIILICLVLTMFFSLIITTGITTPINDIIGVAEKVSGGDFTLKTSKYSIHELNELSKNFNSMTENLKQMLSVTAGLTKDTTDSAAEILRLSTSINDSSKEVVAAVEEITIGSSKQTEETIGCAKVSDKFNGEITNAISSLNHVSSATENSIMVINQSSNIINNLSKTSENNSSAMSKVADTVSELSDNTQNILTILNKINGITKQTNLLALNASIEAARAGDAGKGFSVVANEIRKLAEQSQGASLEIEHIISEVNKSIEASLKISSDAKDLFKEELNQVNTTIESFDKIKTSISEISEAMKFSMKSINIIDEDKNLLYDSINSIAAISEENTAATEEVTATIQSQSESNTNMNSLSKGLNEKANGLIELINKFKF